MTRTTATTARCAATALDGPVGAPALAGSAAIVRGAVR